MFFAAILSFYFYVKSVGPAALEKRIGQAAYRRCGQYREASTIAMMITVINYVVYYFYPLATPLPRFFPWDYSVTAAVATIILIPSLYVEYRGVRAAGREALFPSKEHTLYGGIYNTIRHPQALGEVWLGLVIALYLNSPFLALFSLIYFPAFYYFCIAEEKDLVIRYGQPYIEYRNRTGMFIPKPHKMKDQTVSKDLPGSRGNRPPS
jgi:protein-S-isoprenylcysteine O-methyltransferase Ste14